MNKSVLDEFGEEFIATIRDASLQQFEKVVSAEMKDAESKRISASLAKCTEEQLALIKEVAYTMVDVTLHNILFFFEQGDVNGWKIANEEKGIKDLVAISDGLSGELLYRRGVDCEIQPL